MNIKQWIFLILGFLCGAGLFFIFRIFHVESVNSRVTFSPQEVHTVLQPPKSALTAQITSLTGEVKKQGRTDSDFQKIIKPTTLVQGESLQTISGNATLVFSNRVNLSLSSNTQIDYLNGLPSALVVRQPQGSITYSSFSVMDAFSVRSLALLTQWSDKAELTIQTDAVNQQVVVKVIVGTVTLAYSDADNTTKVAKLIKGETGIFDNEASSLKVR